MLPAAEALPGAFIASSFFETPPPLKPPLLPMSRIRLDTDLAEKLRRRARPQGRSLTNFANLLLRRCLGMKASPPESPSRTSEKGGK